MSKTKISSYTLYLSFVLLACHSCLGVSASKNAADLPISPFSRIQRILELYEKGELMAHMENLKTPIKEREARAQIEGVQLFRIPKGTQEASWKHYQSPERAQGFFIDTSNDNSALRSVSLSHQMDINASTYLSIPVMRYLRHLNKNKKIRWKRLHTMRVPPQDPFPPNMLGKNDEVQVCVLGKNLKTCSQRFFPSADTYKENPTLFKNALKAETPKEELKPNNRKKELKSFGRVILDMQAEDSKKWIKENQIYFFDRKTWDKQVEAPPTFKGKKQDEQVKVPPTFTHEMRAWNLTSKDYLGIVVDYTSWKKQSFADKKKFFMQLAHADQYPLPKLPLVFFDPLLDEGDLAPSQRPSLHFFTPITFHKVFNGEITKLHTLLQNKKSYEYLHRQELFAFPTAFAAYLTKLNLTNALYDNKLEKYLNGYVAQGFSLLDTEQIYQYYTKNHYTIRDILDTQQKVEDSDPKDLTEEKDVRPFLLNEYKIGSPPPIVIEETQQSTVSITDTPPSIIQEVAPVETISEPDTWGNFGWSMVPGLVVGGAAYKTLNGIKRTPSSSRTKKEATSALNAGNKWGDEWDDEQDKATN